MNKKVYSIIVLYLFVFIVSGITLLSFSGCSVLKKMGLIKVQAAEEIKVADRVTGIEQIKEVKAQGQIGAGNTMFENKIQSGGDIKQIITDPNLIKWIFSAATILIMSIIGGLIMLIKLFINNLTLNKKVKHKETEAEVYKRRYILKSSEESDLKKVDDEIEYQKGKK